MTTPADIYEPLALRHYRTVTVHVQAQPDGSIRWDVERHGEVPSTVAGVPSLALNRTAPADPAAIPQVEALIRALVLPADAVELGIGVAP